MAIIFLFLLHQQGEVSWTTNLENVTTKSSEQQMRS